MVAKVRKQVYIDPGQDEMLKRLAKETGESQAEIIRRAIDLHTHSGRFPGRDLNVWAQERAFIRRLIQQGPIPGQRTWKRENLHER